jgi:pimeloyl-[acyl-carrier protein] synthase
MTGGQQTTTNLIGNGLLSLFRNPDQMDRLIAESSLVASAVEELLRYESPSSTPAGSLRLTWNSVGSRSAGAMRCLQ